MSVRRSLLLLVDCDTPRHELPDVVVPGIHYFAHRRLREITYREWLLDRARSSPDETFRRQVSAYIAHFRPDVLCPRRAA